MKEVSIIFPMYNVELYVKESLLSIINQTYHNFELIAVNDGSTDKTVDIFNKIIIENNTLDYKLIERNNGGLSAARNTGLEYATGKWVVFIDSDDVLHPKYLETLLHDAEKYNADLSIAIRKEVNKETLKKFSETKEGALINRSKLMRMMLSRTKFVPYCGCFLVNREILYKRGICFNEQVKFSVDQAFMWQVVDASEKITLNYSQLYNYLIRPGSIMTSSKIEQIITGLEHYSNVSRELKNLPFDSEVLVNKWKMGVLHTTAKLIDFYQFLEVKKRFEVNYRKCLWVPSIKVKILASCGLISDKLLYNIYLKL